MKLFSLAPIPFVCVFIGLLGPVQKGFAQGGSLEIPTIGEQIGQQLAAAMIAAEQAGASKSQFEFEIQNARRVFFRQYSQGSNNAAAENDFSTLLLQKDLYYLTLYALEGTTDEAVDRARAMDAITGGVLDGGIHGSAWRSFQGWVDAVRAQLGAPQRGQLLVVLNSSDLIEAIRASSSAYDNYRRLRDEAEFRAQGLVEDISATDYLENLPEQVSSEDMRSTEQTLFSNSLAELYPDIGESEYSECIEPQVACSTEMYQERIRFAVLNYYPGLYRVRRQTVGVVDGQVADKIVTDIGECALFQEVSVGTADEFSDGSPTPFPIQTSYFGRCWTANSEYGVTAKLQGNGLSLTSDLFGPNMSFFLAEPSGDVLMHYSSNVDLYEAGRGAARAIKFERIADIPTLDFSSLEGLYETRLYYDGEVEDSLEADALNVQRPNTRDRRSEQLRQQAELGITSLLGTSGEYRMQCAISFVGVYEAMNVSCVDQDGVVIRPLMTRGTAGYCRNHPSSAEGNQLVACNRSGPTDTEFVPRTFIYAGRADQPYRLRSIQPRMWPPGEGEYNRLLTQGYHWIIAANPRSVSNGSSNGPQLLLQSGLVSGEMIRIGDVPTEFLRAETPTENISVSEAGSNFGNSVPDRQDASTSTANPASARRALREEENLRRDEAQGGPNLTPAEAVQRRASTPEDEAPVGPTVSGFRGIELGIAFEDAEEIAARDLNMTSIGSNTPSTSFSAFSEFSVLATPDQSEVLTIYHTNGDESHVVGLIYAADLDDDFNPDSVIAEIRASFGPSMRRDSPNAGEWSNVEDAPQCAAQVGRTRSRAVVRYKDGTNSSGTYTPTLSASGTNSDPQELIVAWASCHAFAQYRRSSNRLSIAVHDLSQYATGARSQ